MQNKIFSPEPNSSLVIVVDVQEKLVRAIEQNQIDSLIINTKIILETAATFAMPVLFTEQYPKGLGNTIPELSSFISKDMLFEKTTFSCFGEKKFADKVVQLGVNSIIICGIETHVCVQQTAFDALNLGFNVFIPADAVASRKNFHKETALNLMLSRNVFITSTESIIFALLKDSANPFFKEIAKKIK